MSEPAGETIPAADGGQARALTQYWREAGAQKWFAKDDAFDADLRTRFLDLHWRAARGELAHWEEDGEGALALLLLTDQIPRNVFRGSAHAFATDAMAVEIARRALAAGHDQTCDPALRAFFYLPFMHSENLADQTLCVALCATAGLKNNLDFAELHRDIIVRFGRFPHRNAVMGRTTRADEAEFLAKGGFAG